MVKLLEQHVGADKYDHNRLEQELIYYIEKIDISEERVRLKNHCDYFKDMLKESEPCKGKKLSNMRSTGDGKGISLTPPLKMTLERSLEYIANDEYVEVTPLSLRIRKKILDATARKRSSPTPTA